MSTIQTERIVSSVVFGLGHIPGMIGMGVGVITFKLISTIGMGFYFGMIYKKTKNLWVPIIMHAIIDICALPYCFTVNMRYETISLITNSREAYHQKWWYAFLYR